MQDNFWNEFFSTDKIFIPAIITVIFGIIVLMLCSLMNKELNNHGLIIILSIGFFVGNVIKANILLSDKEKKLSNHSNGKQNNQNNTRHVNKNTSTSNSNNTTNNTNNTNGNTISTSNNNIQTEKGKIIRKK